MLNLQSVQPKFGWLGSEWISPMKTFDKRVSEKLNVELMNLGPLFEQKPSVELLLPWVQQYALESTLRKGTRAEKKQALENTHQPSNDLPLVLRARLQERMDLYA